MEFAAEFGLGQLQPVETRLGLHDGRDLPLGGPFGWGGGGGRGPLRGTMSFRLVFGVSGLGFRVWGWKFGVWGGLVEASWDENVGKSWPFRTMIPNC